MQQFKPGHEVALAQVQRHCHNLLELQKRIREGGVQTSARFIPVIELERGRLQDIGGLVSQLEGLTDMSIPEDALDSVIEALGKIEYHHLAIQATIEKLSSRKTVKL